MTQHPSDADPEAIGDTEGEEIEIEPSDELLELIELAINHAAESIEEGGPLVPILFREKGGEVSAERAMVMIDDEQWDIGASVDKAKEMARASVETADRVATVFDGYITTEEGDKLDCLYIEAFETGLPVTLLLFQCYQPAEHPDGFAFIEEPELADHTDPMW